MNPARLEVLVKRLAAVPNDQLAWAEFYRELWPFVFGVTYRRLRGARDLAEDAAQEVFIRLARTRPFEGLSNSDALRAYVWRVADNAARDYLNRSLRRQSVEAGPLEPGDNREPTALQTAVDERIQLKEWLAVALRELPSVDGAILSLLIDGYRLPEIAEATGLTYSNAGVRVSRLRKRLLGLLGRSVEAKRGT